MSQIPPPSPFQPSPDLAYYGNVAQQRPTVVSGLAITGIIIGSLGILCNGIGVLAQIAVILMGKSPALANTPMMHDPAINAFGVANSTIDLVLCIALLAFSIGALNLKPFSHSALMRRSVIALVWVTVAFIAQVVWVLPATADFMAKQQGSAARTPAMAAGFRAGQVIGAGFVWVLYCTLPVLFLLLWRTPQVLAAFGKTSNGPMAPGVPQG